MPEGAALHRTADTILNSAIRILGSDERLDGVAPSAEEKKEVFMGRALSCQIDLGDDVITSDTTAQIGAREIQEALFVQLVKKSPGIDGLGFKALQLLWRWDASQGIALIKGCITLGYHPHSWKMRKA